MCHHTHVEVRRQAQASAPISHRIRNSTSSLLLFIWSMSFQRLSCLCFPLTLGAWRLHMHTTASSFMWVLGVWTQVLTLTQQGFYLLSQLSSPRPEISMQYVCMVFSVPISEWHHLHTRMLIMADGGERMEKVRDTGRVCLFPVYRWELKRRLICEEEMIKRCKSLRDSMAHRKCTKLSAIWGWLWRLLLILYHPSHTPV